MFSITVHTLNKFKKKYLYYYNKIIIFMKEWDMTVNWGRKRDRQCCIVNGKRSTGTQSAHTYTFIVSTRNF